MTAEIEHNPLARAGQEHTGEIPKVPMIDRIFFGHHMEDGEVPAASVVIERPAGNEITDLEASMITRRQRRLS